MVCAVANAMGIFAGCVPGSWLIRGMVDVGMLIVLFYHRRADDRDDRDDDHVRRVDDGRTA